MVLEAVMLCVDNSDWTRNADYVPTRFDAQKECIQYIASAKLNGNAETTVGMLSMAGQRIDVHTSPTRSIGQIMNAVAKNIHIGGKYINLIGALKTAQLALKNRINKNQRQRCIVFVGSPISHSKDELERIGKLFKKNNISVDIINYGTENSVNENVEKLETLVQAANTADTSHLINIPPGPHILSDLVMNSPIIVDGSAVGGAGTVGGGDGFDADADPEMAMAIRMSMEEEANRQRAATGSGGAVPSAAASTTQPGATAVASAASGGFGAIDEQDEDALLQQAIALSMQADTAAAAAASASTAAAAATTATATTSTSTSQSNDVEMSTDQAQQQQQQQQATVTDDDLANAMNDPDFINSLLTSVPGVQPTQSQPQSQSQSESPSDRQSDKKGDGQDKDADASGNK